MPYKLIYHRKVKKNDLSKIDKKDKFMIKRAIEERLAKKPEFYGRPLRRTLKGYWKLRVGEYRVVYKTLGDEIRIFAIRHRKEVYQIVKKRIDT